MTATDTDLADRYGKRRDGRRSRRAYLIGGLVAVAVGGAVAIVGYQNIGSAAIQTERTSFESLPDDAMRMTFEVTRDTPDKPVVCIVRVRVLDGSEGGRKEVLVPPGESATMVTTVVRSSGEPVTADVFGCSYQVPAYLSTDVPPSG
jgi:uncharacterized protein DUF4307